MEEKIQKEEGISLMDILRLLLSKIKLLLLVVILGALLGGSFAVWRTIDVKNYGTEVQFYVNPDRPKKTAISESSQYGVYGAYGRHVMDNMVKLLASESFTEHMILNGKIIPEPSTEENPWQLAEKDAADAATFNADLNQALKDTADFIDKANTTKEELLTAQNAATEELETLQEAWKSEVSPMDGVSSAYWTYSEVAFNYLQNRISADLKALCENYQKITKPNLEKLQKIADDAVTLAETETENTLSEWRRTLQYKTGLSRYNGCVKYSYLEENADIEDANNLARSFIYVKVSVLNDKALADELYDRVINVVPAYVEENMAVPSDYEGTKCMRISRTDEIRLTNVNYTRNQAIKYAVLFAAATAVISAVIIILIDRSDKRLRDQETITRLFNVPVLGVVPTIDDLSELSAAKKKENKAKQKKQEKTKKKKTARESVAKAETAAAQAPTAKAEEKKAPVKQQAKPANKKKNKGNRR